MTSTKTVSETNNAGKKDFPALPSCGRWVVSGRLKWGYRPVAVVNRAKLEGRTFQTSCCCAIARATRPVPPSRTAIFWGSKVQMEPTCTVPGLCPVIALRLYESWLTSASASADISSPYGNVNRNFQQIRTYYGFTAKIYTAWSNFLQNQIRMLTLALCACCPFSEINNFRIENRYRFFSLFSAAYEIHL